MTHSDVVSVVVRTYNEGAFLGRLFDVLADQRGVSRTIEIVVVDSGSTDDTVAIAKARQVTLIEISKESFDYSRALNLGIEHSCSDLIAILSAHAIPTGPDWMARMLEPFEDARVAGVYSRQEPWPDAYWREEVRLRRMFGTAPQVFDSANTVRKIPFSNAASCVRRDVWAQHRFCLPAAEDIEWATWAVANGHRIVYEPRVSVFHSHKENSRQAAKRLIDLEKAADLQAGHERSLAMTARQAAGAMLRDTVEIRRYTRNPLTQIRLAWDSVLRSVWFVWDFR